uniref:Uncharacterized protein n=1 Tax=Sphaerodactylus townsendi TaxID=933632 RepID=A0ACB8EWN4_9SAUR
MNSSANALLVHGETSTVAVMRTLLHFLAFENEPMKTKVWIMTAEMEFTTFHIQRDWNVGFIHGAISLAVPSKKSLGFQKFIRKRKPFMENEDGFIRDFWENAFACSFPDSMEDKNGGPICTGREKLESLPNTVFEMSMTGHSNSVYDAVYAIAYALQAMQLQRVKHSAMQDTERQKLLHQKAWQLHVFLRGVSFNNSDEGKIAFNQNGELIAGFDIINWVTFPNQSFLRVKVGQIDPGAPSRKVFSIHEEAITWPSGFNQIYISSEQLTFQTHPSQAEVGERLIELGSFEMSGWTWIGVIYDADLNGERFVQDVVQMFSKKNICFDFIEIFPIMTFSTEVEDMILEGSNVFKAAMNSSANALLVHGETQTMAVMSILLHSLAFENEPMKTKVWIMTAEMEFTSLPIQRDWNIDFLHGAISLSVPSKKSLGFQKFIQMRKPSMENEDSFIRDFWENAFACSFPDSMEDKNDGPICTGREKLESLPNTVFEMSMTGHSNSVYDAVYAIAYALQAMHVQRVKHSAMQDTERQKLLHQEPLQICLSIHFMYSSYMDLPFSD